MFIKSVRDRRRQLVMWPKFHVTCLVVLLSFQYSFPRVRSEPQFASFIDSEHDLLAVASDQPEFVVTPPNDKLRNFIDSGHDLLAVPSDQAEFIVTPPNDNLGSFIKAEHDLLAVPSDPTVFVSRNGPVQGYAFEEDNVAVESKSIPHDHAGAVVVPAPAQLPVPDSDAVASENAASTADRKEGHSGERRRRRKPVVTVPPQTQHEEQQELQVEHSPPQPLLPPQHHNQPDHQHIQQQDQQQQILNYPPHNHQPFFVPQNAMPQQFFIDSPGVAITPVVAVPSSPPVEHQAIYIQHEQQPYVQQPYVQPPYVQPPYVQPPYVQPSYVQQPEYEQQPVYLDANQLQPQPINAVAVPESDHGQAELHPLHVYHDIMAHPHKLLEYFNLLLTKFSKYSVPKEHYLNVISFVGVYLFMSYIFYSSEDVLQLTCEATNGKKVSNKEWSYQAGRRFVPASPVDKKLQLKFLELFKGSHLDDNSDGSSSEEDFSGEVSLISELCPRGEFFYSLSPTHIEAWTQLQRLFVAQHTPADIILLAKDLLYKQKVHPKIWYLGLVAAAQERPDMTGFSLAHPLDAMPDLFLPAHLIKDDFDRYRQLSDLRKARSSVSASSLSRIKRAIATIALVPRNNTFIRITKRTTTKKPMRTTTTTTTTTTKPPTSTSRNLPDSAEMDSGEFIGLDGTLIPRTRQDDPPIDSLKSTKSIEFYRQRYTVRQKHKGKPIYKGKQKEMKKKKEHKKKGKKKESEYDDCIIVDGKIGFDNGHENSLWYFREDLMLNQHHWYWHQAYPLNATRHPDRRAELFFFMHRSFLARYNAERLSNGLPRTHGLDFQPGGIIYEPYNSHLADLASEKFWSPRPAKLPLTDIIHIDDPNFSRNIIIPEVLQVYDRLVTAIKAGKLISKSGKYIPIYHTKGIEPLANTVEASELSVNPFFYDAFGLHNLGHFLIALASDPFWKLKIPPGIMADQATAMRDPSFYTFHTFIDDLFEKYKQKLRPYKVIGGEWPLLWRGVEVHHVEVISKGNEVPNQLRTFWTDRKFFLSPGVDGSTDVDDGDHAKVCAVHLAHEPFVFKLVVERKPCAKTKSGLGTVRIFMAPRYDEKGRRLHLKEQRRLMFQLDAFQVKLRVGKNFITRRSHDSSLTKPWSKSLHEFQDELEEDHEHPSGAADFCGCGWPQHLYIPKGHVDGMPYDLFVMLTDYDKDQVKDNPKDLQFPEPCNSPYIFCGHPRRRYPDARPMGYPFDRPPHKQLLPCKPGHSFSSILCQNFNLIFHKQVDTLEQFTAKAPNMKSIVFEIKHLDHFFGNYYHQQESQ